ncbi:integrase [Hymenobacter sp. UYAg731]
MYKISYIQRKTGKGADWGVSVRCLGFSRSTGVNVLPALFNKATGKVSSKLPLHVEWNAQIQAMYNDFEKVLRTVERCEDTVTTELLAKEYDAMLKQRADNKAKAPKTIAKVETALDKLRVKLADLEAEVITTKRDIAELENAFDLGQDDLLTDYVKNYRDDKANDLRDSSKKVYDVLIHNLNQWNRGIKFNEVNEQTLNDFQTYLLGQNKKSATIRTMLVRVKGVANAYSDKLKNPESFRKYKAIKVKRNPTVVFLTKDELRQLEELPLTKMQNDVRNIFVLLCHTGLRWSDRNFTKDNVKNGVVEVLNVKTDTLVKIPLSNKAKEILALYDAPLPENPDKSDYQLPQMDDKYFRTVIKSVCKQIPTMRENVTVVKFSGSKTDTIPKPKYTQLGAHSARRTFVNLCLIAKTNPAVISGWVGHHSLAQTMDYASKDANTKQELANVFN